MVKQRIEQLKALKKNKDGGKLDLIPFYHHFPRLSKYVPGIFRGTLTNILAGTGIGKSKYAKFLSIIIPYEISKMYDFDYKVIYFALEEPKEQFIDEMILMQLYIKYGIEMDRLTLNSMYEVSLSQDILDKIETVSEEVETILEKVDIIDTIKNPTGLFNYVRNYSNQIGTHHYKTIEIDKKDVKVYSHYTQENDKFVLVVTDHIGSRSGRFN